VASAETVRQESTEPTHHIGQVLDVLDGRASLGLDHPTWRLGLDHRRQYRSITDDRSFLYAGALEVRE
jgi:hypothetical protein